MSASPYNGFRALRPEYLELTGGNACAALLLDLFVERAPSGAPWYPRSLGDLSADLYGAFGRAALRSGLALLIEHGYLEVRHAQSVAAWDRTSRYRLTGRAATPATRQSYVEHRGCVYAIRDVASGEIKVGWTSQPPSERLRQLRNTSGRDLALLGTTPGTMVDERVAHEHLAIDRVRGEWFRPSTRVLTWVSEVIA